MLARVLNDFLDPIQEACRRFADLPDLVACAEATQTLALTRYAMGHSRTRCYNILD